MSRFFHFRPGHDRAWGELASAWLDRELTDSEAQRFRVHAAGCRICERTLSSYRAIDSGVQRVLQAASVPRPQQIFDAAAATRRPLMLVPRRLALAASALIVVIGGGAATPQVRDGVGGAVSYVRQIAGSDSTGSFAGDRGLFRADSTAVIASAGRRYGVLAATLDGQNPVPVGDLLVQGGRVWALAANRLLVNAGTESGPLWTVMNRDGSDARPWSVPSGFQVVDVNPAGDRVLLRMPDGHGGYQTTSGATLVVDIDGVVQWQDPGGSNVYSLSADGCYALSGEGGFLKKLPITCGTFTQIPVSVGFVERPQMSADGTRVVYVADKAGQGSAAQSLYYARLADNYTVPYVDPISGARQPHFRLSPDGTRLAVQSTPPAAGLATAAPVSSLTLKIWDLDHGSPMEVPAFRGAEITDLAWSPDSHRLLVLDRRNGRNEGWVYGDGGTPSPLLSGSSAADVVSAAWLPDGSGVVFLSDAGRTTGLVALHASGSGDNLTALVAGRRESAMPVYAQHGRAVALLDGASGSTVLARHGAPPASLPGGTESLSWSPDGRHAALIVAGEAYLWDERTGARSAPFAAGVTALWSPSGHHILVVDPSGVGRVYDGEGNGPATAPADLGFSRAAWSPDGRALLAVRGAEGHQELVQWDPTTNIVRSLWSGTRVGTAEWSPNGRYLALTGSTDGDAAPYLYTIQPGTGQVRRLAPMASLTEDLVWPGDSSRIAFIDRRHPGAAGRVQWAQPDGSGLRTDGDVVVTHLYPGPL